MAQNKRAEEKAAKSAAVAAALPAPTPAGPAAAAAELWPIFAKSGPAAALTVATVCGEPLTAESIRAALQTDGLRETDIDTKPIVLRAEAATGGLRRQGDFSTAFDTYKFDSLAVGPKLLRGQRLKQNCAPALALFDAIGQVFEELAPSSQELIAAAALNTLPASDLKVAQKFMASNHVFFNVSPGSACYVGPDFCYFRTAKLMLEGSRFLVLAPLAAARAALRPSVWAQPELSKSTADC